MRTLWNILVLAFALNFVLMACGVGWLWSHGRLDRKNIDAVRAALSAPAATSQPSTQPAAASSSTQPSLRLDELLARYSGRPAAEQVEFIRQSFEAQMAQLDRSRRELTDLRAQVSLAREQLSKDRVQLDQAKADLAARTAEANSLATDKGFQDSLEMYKTMAPKQVKTIFMGLDDPTVIRYLQAMEPRSAARIGKEFKAPDETERLRIILEKMRLQQPTTRAAS